MKMAVSGDVRRLLTSQVVRAFGYGLGSVLLASSLQARGFSAFTIGVVFAIPAPRWALVTVALTGAQPDRTWLPLLAVVGAVGILKSTYDLPLWAWFRTVPLDRKENAP